MGTIFALTQITATASITVQGRLLARNADVTLDQDMIARPASCIQQADVDAAAAAEAARVEAARAVEAARVARAKAAAARAATDKAAAVKAAAKAKVLAARVLAEKKKAAAGTATGVTGPALPPVNVAGFTG